MTSAAKPDLHLLSADAAPLLPWAGAVEDFLEDLRLARKQPSYLRYYRDVLVPFGEFTGELPPDQVGERDVRAFLARVAEVGVTGRKGVGARRQNGLRDGLFRFFKWLQKHGYVGHNPVEIIPKATVRRRIIRTFTKE
jgi:site-specific recombinase XerC